MKHAYVDSQLGCYSANNTAPCVDNWGVAPYPYTFVGEPAVTSWGPQRLDVFAMAVSSGNPGVLFHRSWDAGLDSGWVLRGHPPGTLMKTSPAATGYSPITTPNTRAGRVDVFVVGVANKIYNGKWNGSAFAWSLWSIYPSGFALVSKAAAASWCPGRMDVMVVDANGNLWDCWGTNFAFSACSLWTPPSGITFTDGAGNVVATPGIGRPAPGNVNARVRWSALDETLALGPICPAVDCVWRLASGCSGRSCRSTGVLDANPPSYWLHIAGSCMRRVAREWG
jgi:hypothetical protein